MVDNDNDNSYLKKMIHHEILRFLVLKMDYIMLFGKWSNSTCFVFLFGWFKHQVDN